MRGEDLAALFSQPPPPGVRYGQGKIVSWNRETFENIIDWNGVLLPNLPLLAGTDAYTFAEGHTVGLLGVDASGKRGAQSWWILGRLVVPGGTEAAIQPPASFSAVEINAEVVNAEQIFVGGLSLAEYVQSLITTQVPASDPDPPPGGSVKLTKTYPAIWSQAYQGNNSRNDFIPSPAQGFYSSTNGNQRSLIGFNSTQIQSDLATATSIVSVKVYLYYDHWYFNSGGTAIIGHHGHSSAPSSFSATTNQVQSSNWPKPGARVVTYNVGTGDWKTGAKKGIAIGPGPSTSREYYGRARGYNESNPPRLQITWQEPA
jgi:hypothetical protein